MKGNSDILYECCLSGAKRNSSLPSTIRGYRSYIYIYLIPSLAFHQRRLVERRVQEVGREAGREAGRDGW